MSLHATSDVSLALRLVCVCRGAIFGYCALIQGVCDHWCVPRPEFILPLQGNAIHLIGVFHLISGSFPVHFRPGSHEFSMGR
jgi:hypothetical protein